MTKIEDKIIEIETKITFQEQTIEALNDVIIGQQKAIETLKRQLQQLNTKVQQESQHWNNEGIIIDEKPPHY